MISELFRETSCGELWQKGDHDACGNLLGPILKQRMQEMTYMGMKAMADEQLDYRKQVIKKNSDLLNERQLRQNLGEYESVANLMEQMEEMNLELMDS